jgi:hypothetical protein
MKTARWFGAVVGMLLGMWVMAFAQSWTAPKTWSQGELVTPDMLNTHLRDNITVVRTGGIAITGQGANEIIFSSSASQLTRSSELVWTGDALTITGWINSATVQPGFLAYNSATDGANTQHTVDFNTEEYDSGADFASDTFTVPTTGIYLLCTNVELQNSVASTNLAYVIISVAGSVAKQYDVHKDTLPASAAGSFGGCVMSTLVAADTVTVIAASASNTTVIGGATGATTFSARLMP